MTADSFQAFSTNSQGAIVRVRFNLRHEQLGRGESPGLFNGERPLYHCRRPAMALKLIRNALNIRRLTQ
jgi:hypothetical protein